MESWIHYFVVISVLGLKIRFLFRILNTALWDLIHFRIVGKYLPDHSVTMYHDRWLLVNEVPSHVLTWGGWIEDPFPGNRLILFMCGIPGITLFYQSFLESLHKLTGLPIWTICIAGHEIPPASSNLQLPKDRKVYDNVQAQIDHKRAFIETYVPKNVRIYFIGHSFGAKMVLEMMKYDKIKNQVDKSILLMPTIERFCETPRAQYWIWLRNTGVLYFIALWTWILSVLPLSWLREFAQLYFWSRGMNQVHECCISAMVQFIHPTVFYNTRTLAWDELEVVKNLDIEVLENQKEKMKAYFTPNDYWAPMTHCESLREAVPGLPVEVLDEKFGHAFTLDRAQEMAEIISKELDNNNTLIID